MSFAEEDCPQKPTTMVVLSVFRGRGADRRWGLRASCGLKVGEETGRLSAFPFTERHRVKIKYYGD